MDETDLTLQFKEGRYYSALWFVAGEDDQNFLAALWRDLPDGPWHLTARWRYTSDDSHWYEWLPPNEEEAFNSVQYVTGTMILMGYSPGGSMHLLRPRTDDPLRVMALLQGHGVVKVREVKVPS